MSKNYGANNHSSHCDTLSKSRDFCQRKRGGGCRKKVLRRYWWNQYWHLSPHAVHAHTHIHTEPETMALSLMFLDPFVRVSVTALIQGLLHGPALAHTIPRSGSLGTGSGFVQSTTYTAVTTACLTFFILSPVILLWPSPSNPDLAQDWATEHSSLYNKSYSFWRSTVWHTALLWSRCSPRLPLYLLQPRLLPACPLGFTLIIQGLTWQSL